MLRLSALILVSGVITVAFASSQGPTPNPAASTHHQQAAASKGNQQAKKQQPGTDKVPLVVKLTNTGQTDDERQQNRQDIQEQTATNREILIATATLAGATTVLVVIGFVQLILFVVQLKHIRKGTEISRTLSYAARSSARVANKTLLENRDLAIRELRAYVFVHEGHITNVANPPIAPAIAPAIQPTPQPGRITDPLAGPKVHIEMKNSGKTPAYNVIHWLGIDVAPYPSLGNHQLPGRNPAFPLMPCDMAPGGIVTKDVTYFRLLDPHEIADIRAFTKAVYVYGFIEYTDVFGEKRRTEYRATHNAIRGALGTHTDLTFSAEGNKAD